MESIMVSPLFFHGASYMYASRNALLLERRWAILYSVLQNGRNKILKTAEQVATIK